MSHIRRILVAVKDPGAPSLPGVAKAAQLAQAWGAELTLFHAVPAPLALAMDQRCLELERIAQRLRRRALQVSVAAQRDHPTYVAILREAARICADLVVAETHPRAHHGAALLQLTDWELVRHSPIPVLLVKRCNPYRRPKVLVALDPDHTFGKPRHLDGEILALGTAVTEALQGTLHAVHAYAPVPPGAVSDGSTSAEAIAQIEHENEAIAAQKLAAAVRRAEIPIANQYVVGRHVPDAIEQVAAESRSAIVVIGAVARSGLAHVLIGNTAERVLDLLPCDILVVKPTRIAAHRPRASAQSVASQVITGF